MQILVNVSFNKIRKLFKHMQERDEDHALGAKNSVTGPTSTLNQEDKT